MNLVLSQRRAARSKAMRRQVFCLFPCEPCTQHPGLNKKKHTANRVPVARIPLSAETNDLREVRVLLYLPW